MKILHYSLGFPPERSGGLVRYSIDLAKEQANHGNEVTFLYPGRLSFIHKDPYIKKDKKHSEKNFISFSLVNSLPLPIFGGIKIPNDFNKKVNPLIFKKFLLKIKPDVIHIHTIMGLYKEFFTTAHDLHIKIIFTSHDYFGIAPEPTFFYMGGNYIDNNSVHQWIKISQTALSTKKLRLFQSKLYPVIRIIAKFLKVNYSANTSKKDSVRNKQKRIVDFKNLKQYYLDIFAMIDFFHFNSTLSQKIYSLYLNLNVNNFKCISITNKRIKNRLDIHSTHVPLRVGYIGQYKDFKGFYDFLKLTRILGNIVEFHIYGSNQKVKLPPNIFNHGKFSDNGLREVYENLDVLIVPSKWKETFGFVTLEALSFGTKVLVSKNVGSKDLIDDKFIFNSIDDVPNILKHISEYSKPHVKEMNDHYFEMQRLYRYCNIGEKNVKN